MNPSKILIASHGTPGARAAEIMAVDLCRKNKGQLHHLLVVPDFWKGMMGDDWLNNAVTQSRFGNYVESQLTADAAREIERFETTCRESQIPYSQSVRLGKPATCLLQEAGNNDFDLVVIGSPRPRGEPGFRSRLDLDEIARALGVPLLIAPWSNEVHEP